MYIGIDLGGTNLKVGVLNDNNEIIFRHIEPTNASFGGEHVINLIIKSLSKLLNRFPKCITVGIGVPAVVDNAGIITIAPNIPDWLNLNLLKILKDKFSLNIAIDNDANVAAFAELILGAGKDINNFLYITLGTGVGGTIVINRRIFRGESGGAGEFGHLVIDLNDDVHCDKPFRVGILEEFVGRTQITKYAYDLLRNCSGSLLLNYEKPDPYFISEAAQKGDDLAKEILSRVGYLLGISITSALNLLDIYTVIIGGGVSLCHQCMYDSLISTVKRRALPNVAKNFILKKAYFNKEAGIYGSALFGKYNNY